MLDNHLLRQFRSSGF